MDLGELTIEIVVKDKRVWYIFNSQREKTKKIIELNTKNLKDQMEAIDYVMIGLKAVMKKVDVNKYILPKLDLDGYKRINTEV